MRTHVCRRKYNQFSYVMTHILFYFDIFQVEYIFELNTVVVSQFDPLSNRLVVDCEDKYSGDLWRGDFSAKFVEELTNKTGTFKKFAVFVKMVLSALKTQAVDQGLGGADPKNNVVSLNLLSQQDLIELKTKKTTGEQAASLTSSTNQVGNKFDKKYLILTFEGEFEQVHYPMPLHYLDEPDMQTMLNTFQRLQGHIEMSMTSRSVLQTGHRESNLIQSERAPDRMNQSELNGGMHRHNTMQEFFQIEAENE